MCESYKKPCVCGRNTSEIFFGKMVLNETAVSAVYCPKCSETIESRREDRLWDNGWVLDLKMDIVRTHAPSMGIPPDEVTADWVFDQGYVTWVGITPDDFQTRDHERSEIQKLAKTDLRAYMQTLKEWGMSREKRFINEGWRKAK